MKKLILIICLFSITSPSTAYAGKTPAATITKVTPTKVTPTKVTPTPTKQSSFKNPLNESQMRDCLKTSSSSIKCAKG